MNCQRMYQIGCRYDMYYYLYVSTILYKIISKLSGIWLLSMYCCVASLSICMHQHKKKNNYNENTYVPTYLWMFTINIKMKQCGYGSRWGLKNGDSYPYFVIQSMGVSRNGDTRKNGWFINFIMDNPISMDDLGIPPFQEMPILCKYIIYCCISLHPSVVAWISPVQSGHRHFVLVWVWFFSHFRSTKWYCNPIY